MRVLIIEDDEFKSKRIANVVRALDIQPEIILERSVNSGLKAIVECRPDLILLDMSLTTFDIGPNEIGGRPQNFGGIEVLRHMDRLEIQIPVIVITQHERFARGSKEMHLSGLHKELTEEHHQVFRGLIYYKSAEGAWERQLRAMILQKPEKGGGSHGKGPTRRR